MCIVMGFVNHYDTTLGSKVGDSIGGIDAMPGIGVRQRRVFGRRDAIVEWERHHCFVVQAQFAIHRGQQLQRKQFLVAIDHGEDQVTVADVDEAKRRLVAHGCEIVKDEPEFPRCYVRDPMGLIYNLRS